MPAASCNRDSLVDLLWDQSWAGNCLGWIYGPIVRRHHRVLVCGTAIVPTSMLHSKLSPPSMTLARETYT